MKPQIIQEIGADLAGKTESEARRIIKDYFARIRWSLEKAEWERMSEPQRAEFVKQASSSSAR
jgi:hypothetical protein